MYVVHSTLNASSIPFDLSEVRFNLKNWARGCTVVGVSKGGVGEEVVEFDPLTHR